MIKNSYHEIDAINSNSIIPKKKTHQYYVIFFTKGLVTQLVRLCFQLKSTNGHP